MTNVPDKSLGRRKYLGDGLGWERGGLEQRTKQGELILLKNKGFQLTWGG